MMENFDVMFDVEVFQKPHSESAQCKQQNVTLSN